MNIKLIGCAMAATMLALAGCKDEPTATEMENLGKVSGYTAAYVLNNQVKVDDATRNGIIAVMNEVEKYVPVSNETYAATWSPIVKQFLDKGVAEKKITQEVADRVLKDFGYIVGLLDAYLEKKGVSGKTELANVFVHAFFDSFLANFKPANVMSATVSVKELDKLTLKILNGLIK